MQKKKDVICFFCFFRRIFIKTIFKIDITPDNFKNQFKFGYTQKEIEEIFEKYNKEKDGRLTIDDFIKMILPIDYAIEEKEEI